MSLNASELKDRIIAKFDELNQNLDPDNLPDYLSEMSSIISSYIEEKAEVEIIWVAQDPATLTPDPDMSNPPKCRLTGVNIQFSKSECSSFVDPTTSPKLIKELFSGKISAAMILSTVIGPEPEDPANVWTIVSMPLGTADPAYAASLYTPNLVYSFDFGNGIKGYDSEGNPILRDYKENMEVFCENLISKIKSFTSVTPVSITTASSHLSSGITYISTTSTLKKIT